MRKKYLSPLLFFFLSVLSTPAVCDAGLQALLQKTGLSGSTLNDSKIGLGIKEALRAGIDKTVAALSRKDGYLGNPELKISMPEKFRLAEAGLRKVGMGPHLDAFVVSMNRSAEAAAPYARDIFVEMIAGMSLDDVQAVWKGGDTAATDYFRQKSRAKLLEVYKPVIVKTMGQYQVGKNYQELVARYQALPLASRFKAPEIEQYVAEKSLEGLFLMLGKQEALIRKDPAARTTQLLKDVFGGLK